MQLFFSDLGLETPKRALVVVPLGQQPILPKPHFHVSPPDDSEHISQDNPSSEEEVSGKYFVVKVCRNSHDGWIGKGQVLLNYCQTYRLIHLLLLHTVSN